MHSFSFFSIFMVMQDLIRRFILETISESNEKKAKDDEDQEDLLTEPDYSTSSDEDPAEQNEQSVAGAVAGVTTPLGTGPTYPSPRFKKPKPPAYIAGRAFGGAKPVSKKKKRKKKFIPNT